MEKYYDKNGHAEHYNSHRINALVQMEQIWGTEKLMTHYEMTVFEYRFRLGTKDPELIPQDMIKIKWFETTIEYLRDKIDNGDEVDGLDFGPHPLPGKLQAMHLNNNNDKGEKNK